MGLGLGALCWVCLVRSCEASVCCWVSRGCRCRQAGQGMFGSLCASSFLCPSLPACIALFCLALCRGVGTHRHTPLFLFCLLVGEAFASLPPAPWPLCIMLWGRGLLWQTAWWALYIGRLLSPSMAAACWALCPLQVLRCRSQ